MRAPSAHPRSARDRSAGRSTQLFADFADWHSNASPLVGLLTDQRALWRSRPRHHRREPSLRRRSRDARAAHAAARRTRFQRAGRHRPDHRRRLGAGAFQSGHDHCTIPRRRSRHLPVAALRLDEGADHEPHPDGAQADRPALRAHRDSRSTARFGAGFLLRLDQALGLVEERLVPRLPLVDYYAERRFAEPIGLMDDVLMTARDLALQLTEPARAGGLGGADLPSLPLSHRPQGHHALGQCGARDARCASHRAAVHPSLRAARRRIRCGLRHRHDPARRELAVGAWRPRRPVPSRRAMAPRTSTSSTTA